MADNSVLFVDDEINVISAIRRGVSDEPYRTFFAGSGQEALKIMEEHPIDVIVTDMRMPEMDGLALLKIVKEQYPQTVRVVLSGYTQLSQILVTINQGEIFKFITKPWNNAEELLPAIRQAVAYYNLQRERDILRDNLAKRNAAYQNILRAMEKKRDEEKNEFAHLKEITGWIFAFWRKYALTGEADRSAALLKEFTDVAEEIYLTYLSQLPTVIESKQPADMLADIAAGCHDHVAVIPLAPPPATLRGNHKFLIMIFRILAYYLATDRDKLNFDLAAEPPEGDKQRLLFTAQTIAVDSEAAAKLALAATLLNKMGKPYGLNITIDRDGKRRISGLRLTWQLGEDAPPPEATPA